MGNITNDEVALAGDGLEDWPVRYVRPGGVGEVPVVRVRHHLPGPAPEAGVLKKLSLAGLAKLSRLRYS
jgi:hypothetical protein